MPYRLPVPKRVQTQFDALPQSVFDRLDERITALCDDPRPIGVTKLRGSTSAYPVRVGDYRIVYEVDDAREVRLITVANRKDVYS